MGTSNLSVTWDASLAASAGEIPAGRVLTKDTAGRFVLATTANRAVWTGATMFAVSLTAGRGDQNVQACHAGFVPSSIVGTLSGSGSYVDCQSDGTMARATVSSANTIADYLPTGDIVVQLGYQTGAAATGNATAIQGVTVSSASGAASYELRGDGTNIRSVLADAYHLEDFGTLDTTGATSSYTAWAAALAATPSESTLVVPDGIYKIDTAPLVIRDDNTGGNKHGIRIVGPGGNELRNGGAILRHHIAEPSSTVITYVSHGTSGTKFLRLAGWTGLDATLHTGRVCWLWNSANAGPWIVAKVHNSTTLSLYQPNTALYPPVSDATLSGAIRGRIDMPLFEIRARGVVLENLAFEAGAGVRCGELVSIRNPPGLGYSLVTRPQLIGVKFGLADSTASARHALTIGLPYVPDSDNATYYSATGQDGTDTNIPLVADSAARGNGNVSEGLVSGFYAQYAGWYSTILHGSTSGQSAVWKFLDGTILPVIGAYCVPVRHNANAHADFEDFTFSDSEDFCIRTNGNNRPRRYTRCYIEAGASFLADRSGGNTNQVSILRDCYLRQTASHPSGAMVEVNSQGPTLIQGGRIGNSGNNPWQMRMVGGSVSEVSYLSLDSITLEGLTTYSSGAPARGYGDSRCPFYMDGTWELDLEEDALSGGAHIRTFAFTSANFTSAGCFTYPWPNTTISEIYLAQVAKCIRYLATLNGWGITAWVDEDQTRLWVASTTVGASSRLRISTHARGGKIDASVPLGLAAGTYAGTASNSLGTDTSGLLESFNTLTSPGTVNPCNVTMIGCNYYNAAGTQQTLPTIIGKNYGTITSTIGKTIMGQRFSPPGGTFTMGAANNKTVADTRVKAGTVVRLTATNAAAATLMAGASSLYQDVAATTADASFVVKTADAAAAAGTETFSYTLEEVW